MNNKLIVLQGHKNLPKSVSWLDILSSIRNYRLSTILYVQTPQNSLNIMSIQSITKPKKERSKCTIMSSLDH